MMQMNILGGFHIEFLKERLWRNHLHKGKLKSQRCSQNGNFCWRDIHRTLLGKHVHAAIPETKLNRRCICTEKIRNSLDVTSALFSLQPVL